MSWPRTKKGPVKVAHDRVFEYSLETVVENRCPACGHQHGKNLREYRQHERACLESASCIGDLKPWEIRK